MKDAGVALVDSVPAAGNGVAHQRTLGRAPALDSVVLAAAAAHDVPFCPGTVVVP